MLCTTVRQILANTEKKYGPEDAVRYKISKNEIAWASREVTFP